ncbi:hypothetical protein O6H91_Y172700 [Diphasiastrum complanatum]|nr:hypothetical protein O6H91_Y172700 [Diphasiastrum complanatum]
MKGRERWRTLQLLLNTVRRAELVVLKSETTQAFLGLNGHQSVKGQICCSLRSTCKRLAAPAAPSAPHIFPPSSHLHSTFTIPGYFLLLLLLLLILLMLTYT